MYVLDTHKRVEKGNKMKTTIINSTTVNYQLDESNMALTNETKQLIGRKINDEILEDGFIQMDGQIKVSGWYEVIS